MALKLYNETDIEAIADAIRGKNGSSDTYTVSQMAQAIDDIPSGGGGSGVDALLFKELVSGSYTQNWSIPGDTVGRAFASCVGSVDLTFPEATTLRVLSYAFEASTFNSLSFPIFVGSFGSALRNYKGKHVYAPNVTDIGGYCFDGASNLEEAFFPKATVSGRNAFNGCGKLETAVVKNMTASFYVFNNCTVLRAVDICGESVPNLIDTNIFGNCSMIDTVVIRSTTVATLNNINAFVGSPFASGGSGGTLYVPSSLISSYQSATNWSTILEYTNNQIKAIEGSIYETQYADGTPISS